MRVEELIGARVREARSERGWTQAQLGAEMSKHVEGGWSNITVSLAETGRRAFAAADLVALAAILGKPMAWFLVPFDDENEIELSGGSLSPQDYRALSGAEGLLIEFAEIAGVIRATALDMLNRIHWMTEELSQAGVPIPESLRDDSVSQVIETMGALKESVEQGKAATTRKLTGRKSAGQKGGRK